MELLKGREEIIRKIEGPDFHEIKNCKEIAVLLNGREVQGEPFIRDEEAGRIFGIYTPELGEVEIYSYKFNNLTNANVTLVRFR